MPRSTCPRSSWCLLWPYGNRNDSARDGTGDANPAPADRAQQHRDDWAERGLDLLTSLGLPAAVEVANDPFFGRSGRMLAANQRAEVLAEYKAAPVNPNLDAKYKDL